jgi:outer membrane protein OmpA-like peptidoglycan-associated protein
MKSVVFQYITIFILSVFFLQVTYPSKAQGDPKLFKSLFRQAESYAINENFEQAIDIYHQLIRMDPSNSNIQFLQGYCFNQTGSSPKEVIPYFEKAVLSINKYYRDGSHLERGAPPLAHFLLGKSYQRNYEFDKAIESFTRYKDYLDVFLFSEIEYVNLAIRSCETAKKMVLAPVPVDFLPLNHASVPGRLSSNPVISGNDSIMVFKATGASGNGIAVIRKLNKGWSGPEIIDSQISMSGEYYPVSLSFDGSELYLVSRSDNNSEIFHSFYDGRKWSKGENLGRPVNSKYSETHASISSDNKTLFFTSNRKGGWGGMDIYKSERDENGLWKEPVNLGFDINTYYNEETPFISRNDSLLYFSSEGLETMGGYDIFSARMDRDGKFNKIENLGFPISTPGDDLFFNPGWDGRRSYHARPLEKMESSGGIYAVIPRPRAVSSEAESELAVAESEAVQQHQSEGEYYYIVNSIRFGFDQYDLDESAVKEVKHILEMLRMFPEIELELIGHTDSIGPKDYNFELSKRRVQSVKDFLVNNGISDERLKIFAAGEDQPLAINAFPDGSDAPEGRALNRNVSLRINNKGLSKIFIAEIFVPPHLVPEQDRVFTILLFESEHKIDSIPVLIDDQSVSLVITDESMLYTLGSYNTRMEAQKNLEAVIDLGYTQAGIMEKRRFEQLIGERTAGDKRVFIRYTIQLIALKKPVESAFFKDLEDVSTYRGEDGIYRYAYGSYSDINEAREALESVKQKGFDEAFIRPVRDYLKSLSD